ncbi:MAG: hypothetical protein NTX75_07070 [Proteobacteria bacterium]|nr:hypothetical protein [Pseudomonadota bacterium]
MIYPFEVPFEDLETDLDSFAITIFSLLQSEFLVLPKGVGFVDYTSFEKGYEVLKRVTAEFQKVTLESVAEAVSENPVVMIVIRTVLGFTPPEWAYIATQRTDVEVSQGFARSLDRSIRMQRFDFSRSGITARNRILALIETACALLNTSVPYVEPDKLHRLEKADTREGLVSIKSLARMGAPYAMLLYERFLGRPFAGHRDSVSELVGDSLESAIEDVLAKAGVSYRKTKRAEHIPGFDQAPDFIIPSEFNPQVVIEAKLTEDDGTARDKVTRIQHLSELSQPGGKGTPKFEVIACIGGRGFGVRREDMRKLLIATRGKVFTLRTLQNLVENTRIKEFKSI